MTRKDYIRIAAALKAARVANPLSNASKAVYNNGVDNAAHRVADALVEDSGRFDRARFLEACGVAL